MTSLENQISGILGEAKECLTLVEITIRLNTDFGSLKIPYSVVEVQRCADRMRNVVKLDSKYCLRPADADQASAQGV